MQMVPARQSTFSQLRSLISRGRASESEFPEAPELGPFFIRKCPCCCPTQRVIMKTPPGISYLITRGPGFCVPGVGAYLLNNLVLRNLLGIHLPIWLSTVLYVLAAPILFSLTVLWSDFNISARAKSMGAVLPPTMPAKYPGGLDFMIKVTKMAKTMYPGKQFKDFLCPC